MYKVTTNRDIRLAEAAMSTQSANIHGRCNIILNQSGLKKLRFNHSTNCDEPFTCERFEPKTHFIGRLNMIVWVNAVLNKTVVESD